MVGKARPTRSIYTRILHPPTSATGWKLFARGIRSGHALMGKDDAGHARPYTELTNLDCTALWRPRNRRRGQIEVRTHPTAVPKW
jgi:hypothetical protein